MQTSAVSQSNHDVGGSKKSRRIFTPHFYFILWCGCIMAQSMLVSGFLNVVLSTIQVEFQMSSAKAAIFPSNYDIAVAVTVLLVSHFGSSHKPRTLGVGMILLATGSLLFALAHFIFANDSLVNAENSKNIYLCDVVNSNSDNIDKCSEEGIGNRGAYALLTAGSVLIGLGASPVYTAGTTFCDEIFPPDKVSVYFGISYGIGAAAPALGYILGGVFLGYYKTLREPPEGLTVDHTNWVGAWWLGFLICAVMGYIFGLLLLTFPAQLPECEEVKRKKLECNIQITNGVEEAVEFPDLKYENQTFVELLREMLPLLKGVFKNPVFMLVIIGSITDSLIVSSFAAWLPKLVESQFGLSSSMAAYITGGVTVPGAAGGIIISGLIVKFRKLTGLQCAKYQFYIGIVCCIVQLGLLIHCPTLSIDGVNTPTNSTCAAAASSCTNCPSTDVYEPVCIDGTTYTSPCIAACTTYNAASQEFSDCCGGDVIASVGFCDSGCKWLVPFIIVLLIIMFFTFLNNIIFLTVNLRCVKDSERVIAVSLQSVAFRVFGAFPGPIILGTFFDRACILWNENDCGERGACQEYDNNKLMAASVTLAMIAKVVGTVFYGIGWRVWVHHEQKQTPVYSDEVKCGVVTNALAETDKYSTSNGSNGSDENAKSSIEITKNGNIDSVVVTVSEPDHQNLPVTECTEVHL